MLVSSDCWSKDGYFEGGRACKKTEVEEESLASLVHTKALGNGEGDGCNARLWQRVIAQ